jgi:hypothetical protein
LQAGAQRQADGSRFDWHKVAAVITSGSDACIAHLIVNSETWLLEIGRKEPTREGRPSSNKKETPL